MSASQCSIILDLLQSGQTVTPLLAFELCGSLACHSRIAELREQGYRIDCRMVTAPNGRKHGEYRLVESAPA